MRGAHQAFFLDDDEKTRCGYAFIYGNGDWETPRAYHEKSMREVLAEASRLRGLSGVEVSVDHTAREHLKT